MIVVRRGQVLGDYYAPRVRPDALANIKSASKSIIAILIGIAIERRLIPDVKQPISAYFPELAKDPDPRKRAITVEDLLTMRSGLESTSGENYGQWVKSANWVRYALRQPIVSEPGTAMQYSTGSSHLLSAILTRVSRTDTWQFAQNALFTPLGLRLARWPRDPQGIYFGGNEMLMTPRQMVAIGELYLNRGRFKGRHDRAGGLGRDVMRATDDVCMGRGAPLRLRLVGAALRPPHGVLRLGLRRSIHLRDSSSRASEGRLRHRRDIVNSSERSQMGRGHRRRLFDLIEQQVFGRPQRRSLGRDCTIEYCPPASRPSVSSRPKSSAVSTATESA